VGRPAPEVADIFRDHGPAWRKANAGHVSLGQLKCESLDLIHRTMSDFAIHLTADIIGEADPVLSMTALRAAAACGRAAIIDKTGPLAKLAAKR
jgi:hypothetical protein